MNAIKDFVDQIIADGVITNQEHEQFMELVHQDGKIDPQETEQISRVFALISQGKVKVVDKSKKGTEDRSLIEAKAQAIGRDLELELEQKDFESAQLRASAQDCELQQARRKEIATVVEKSVAEIDSQDDSIAEFLKQAQSNDDTASEKANKNSTTNSLLLRAKERLAAEDK